MQAAMSVRACRRDPGRRRARAPRRRACTAGLRTVCAACAAFRRRGRCADGAAQQQREQAHRTPPFGTRPARALTQEPGACGPAPVDGRPDPRSHARTCSRGPGACGARARPPPPAQRVGRPRRRCRRTGTPAIRSASASAARQSVASWKQDSTRRIRWIPSATPLQVAFSSVKRRLKSSRGALNKTTWVGRCRTGRLTGIWRDMRSPKASAWMAGASGAPHPDDGRWPRGSTCIHAAREAAA